MQKRKEKHINIRVLLLALAMLLPNITTAFHIFHHDIPSFTETNSTLIQQTQPDCHCADLQLTPALIYTIGVPLLTESAYFDQPVSFSHLYTEKYIPLHFQLRAPPSLN